MLIELADNYIRMKGHAKTREVCGMVSAVTVMIANGLKSYLNENCVLILREGYFYLDKKDISEKGKIIVDVFERGLCQLASEHPDSLYIWDNRTELGTELNLS